MKKSKSVEEVMMAEMDRQLSEQAQAENIYLQNKIKLPKHKYDSVFEKAKQYNIQDEKFQAIITALSNCIAPSSYPLCTENALLDAYIKAVEEYDGEMAEHLSYYFYEASGMDSPICTYKGKKYNAKDYEEYYHFYIANE